MLVEAISSFLVGAIERLGKKAVDKYTQPSAKETNNDRFRENHNQTDQEIWNIVTLCGKYKEVWSIYRTEGLLEAIKIRDEKMEFDLKVSNFQISSFQSTLPKNHSGIIRHKQTEYEELNELDLAIVKSTVSHFREMPDIILKYHERHYASREEAKVLAKYYRETVDIIQDVKTKDDLKNLIVHLENLMEKTSKYRHRKTKHRWSEGLKRVILRLENIK